MGPLCASLSKYVLCVHAGLWEQWTHKSHKMKMNRSTKFHVFIEASPFRLSSGHTNYFISAVAYSYFRRLRRPRDKIMDALWPGNENDSAIWCWLSYFLPSARECVHFISFHFGVLLRSLLRRVLVWLIIHDGAFRGELTTTARMGEIVCLLCLAAVSVEMRGL